MNCFTARQSSTSVYRKRADPKTGLKRPTVKSAESPECDSHAEQESAEDSEPDDHKALAVVGVAAMSRSRKTESKEA